LAIFIFNLMQ